MSENSYFLKSLQLNNLLSFGSEAERIELQNLNVIIGANGSGKSNLIESISLLQAAPKELPLPIRKGGGVRDWVWKGANDKPAQLDVILNASSSINYMPIRYKLAFAASNQRFLLVDERLENQEPKQGENDPYIFYRYNNNHPQINVNGTERRLQRDSVDIELSILSQRKSSDEYPELTWVGEQFSKIRIYREWSFGRKSLLRQPQAADAPNDFLAEDCLNLGLVLNHLEQQPKVKRKILGHLKDLYAGIDNFGVKVEGGTVQIFLYEGDFAIPATRLSDGTVRYLCLLAILCHPTPPPLICIEEPELGLHTDILPTVGKLLKKASERTQIIVTTHSDVLVDELSDTPESVLTCEKHEGSTAMNRLNREELEEWLEKYSLGELWKKGEIGANRW